MSQNEIKDLGASPNGDRAAGLTASAAGASSQSSIPSAWQIADSLENSLSVAAITPGFGNDMAVWSSLAGSVQQAIAHLRDSELCPYCDGTGDVHRINGEWLGTCHCAAGAKIASRVEQSK